MTSSYLAIRAFGQVPGDTLGIIIGRIAYLLRQVVCLQ